MYSSSDHTFVICAYQESPYLDECIRSAISQSLPSNVIIITSTPNYRIRTLADQFGIPLRINSHTPGIAADWNAGLAITDSPLVTICHQDDLYHQDYLSVALERLNRVKNPLILFSNYSEIRNGQIIPANINLRIKMALLFPLRVTGQARSRLLKRRLLSLGNPICCPSVLYVKEKLPVPLFQTGMWSNVDWQAWETLSWISGSFVYCPEKLVLHRIHTESETSRVIAENLRILEDLQMFKMFWPRPVAEMLARAYSASESANRLLDSRQHEEETGKDG